MSWPPGVKAIAYADDLALTAVTETTDRLIRSVETALDKVYCWLKKHHLQLAGEKIEAVILKGRKKGRKRIKFELRGSIIAPKKTVTYFGVCLDQRCIFGDYVTSRVNKADKTAGALC